ncbi:TetR/AcrR family transcriptional regulator [Longispora urticae]
MPKKVDHEERRRALAEAVFAVIGDRGIEAVSLRDVARQADVSLGTVQHYFATKHEMLLFALGHLRDRIGRRLAAEMALLPQPATRRATVRHTLRATMPIDGPSRHEAVVTIAFFSYATVDPAYARLLHDSYTRILAVLRGWFTEAEAAGELRAGIDAATEATSLYVLTQGLVGPLLIGTFTPEEAVGLLDGALDRIFAP